MTFSDATRFEQWVEACNNPRIQKMDAMAVHKRYRICRRHFDKNCLNGGCRRLLNTAVPTLYLEPSTEITIKSEKASHDDGIIILPVDADNTEEHFELLLTEKTITVGPNNVKGEFQLKNSAKKLDFLSLFSFYGYFLYLFSFRWK